MSDESEWYNQKYSLHDSGAQECRQSIHDLDKARDRVQKTIEFFGIDLPQGSTALDVGCGLGYWSEALRQRGFHVTGIDTSSKSIEVSQKSFPEVEFKCASFPEQVSESFDLIWAVDLPVINSHDTNVIDAFISSSARKLNPNGVLVIGWHTNFSGQTIGNYAQWNLSTLHDWSAKWDLEGPAIVQTSNQIFNSVSLHICRLIRKTAPIFLVLKT